MYRLVVLISGQGTNLQAIIDAIAAKTLPAQIAAVISNRPNAYGLERAKQAQVPTNVLKPSDYPSREAYDQVLQQCIDSYQPDLVLLAGFMRILTANFVNHYANRIINLHPSLLPNFPGLNTHEQVVKAHCCYHGASIHLVTAELDSGPIIAQGRLGVAPEDTAVKLQQKVQQIEHQLYPMVINWFATQRLQCRDDGLYLDNLPLGKQGRLVDFTSLPSL